MRKNGEALSTHSMAFLTFRANAQLETGATSQRGLLQVTNFIGQLRRPFCESIKASTTCLMNFEVLSNFHQLKPLFAKVLFI
jgi:hypothetical protein